MRIGILQADHVHENLLPIDGEYPDMVMQLLTAADMTLQFRVYCAIDNEFPASPDECDAFVVTGGKDHVYDPFPWLKQTMEFIRQCHAARKKLAGICLGHQLIAQAMGGRADKADRGYSFGALPFSITEKRAWMDPALEEVTLLYANRDQVIDLPGKAVLLGGAEFCPNALFSIDDILLGMQGHPEFSVEYDRGLLDMRKSEIGEAAFAAALKTYRLPLSNAALGRWILNFLKT